MKSAQVSTRSGTKFGTAPETPVQRLLDAYLDRANTAARLAQLGSVVGMRIERRGGPTPSGGAYSEAYLDDDGRIVEIVEHDASGKAIARTYGGSPRA